jgi:phosphatidylglycerophosphatase A
MKTALSRLATVIATWFGCGLVPKAPGTVGSIGAIPLYLLVARGGQVGVAVAAVLVTAVGVWAASVVARERGLKDPQVVVVDEVAGMLVTMLPLRVVSWQGVLAGLVIFRVLDVLKPWPIRRLEALPGGWGIVMDDVGAGVVGAALMAGLVALRVLP